MSLPLENNRLPGRSEGDNPSPSPTELFICRKYFTRPCIGSGVAQRGRQARICSPNRSSNIGRAIYPCQVDQCPVQTAIHQPLHCGHFGLSWHSKRLRFRISSRGSDFHSPPPQTDPPKFPAFRQIPASPFPSILRFSSSCMVYTMDFVYGEFWKLEPVGSFLIFFFRVKKRLEENKEFKEVF